MREDNSAVVALIARVQFDGDPEPAYAVMRRSTYGDGWEAVSFDQAQQEFNGETVSKRVSVPIENAKIDAIEAYVLARQPEPLPTDSE